MLAARSCRVDCSNDTRDVQAQYRPLRVAQHDRRDGASRQLLLLADIFVRSDQHVESFCLGGFQQFAVLKRVPSSLSGCLDQKTHKRQLPHGPDRNLTVGEALLRAKQP